ncbi:MAG: integration host factor subunit beta [Endomicrobium sp.]|jgi:nucleoid DNA-binding protein|nr:integration host factor subunit beta [Endomicrobium sp.]
MNKNDIANALVSLLSSKKEAMSVVDRVFKEMSNALRNGEKVVITGFGSFKMTVTQTKKGRNPKTGEKLLIAPMKKVKFKQTKEFFEK